jgi:hypothetical protein
MKEHDLIEQNNQRTHWLFCWPFLAFLVQILISISVCLWNNTGADLHPLVGNSSSVMENLRGVEGHDVIAPHALDPCLPPIITLNLTKVICVVEDLGEGW